MIDTPPLPARFSRAVSLVRALERDKRYLGAFIFGSVAEGRATADSDLDVRVVVDEDNPCANINHPVMDGYKLDLTFRSLRQETEHNEKMIGDANRLPNLTEAIILFDKTGELARLKERAQAAEPAAYGEHDYQFVQFLAFHADSKIRRYLKSDPANALFVMHCNLQEILRIHYRLAGRWWVSSKLLLNDLRAFDPALAGHVEDFVCSADAMRKFAHWSAIVDHVLQPLGGRQPIEENNCACDVCARDLGYLLAR